MKLIGLCGEIGAGKDTIADYLIRKHEFTKIVMSDIITEELKRLNREINRTEMQNIGKEYKEKFGMDVWAKACLEYAKKNQIRKVVISGIRDSAESDYFRKALGKDFIFVYVTSDKDIRFQRLLQRKSEKDPKNVEELEIQESREKELFNIYKLSLIHI